MSYLKNNIDYVSLLTAQKHGIAGDKKTMHWIKHNMIGEPHFGKMFHSKEVRVNISKFFIQTILIGSIRIQMTMTVVSESR